MKKIFAILLALTLALTSTTVAFADPELETPIAEDIIPGMYASGTYTVNPYATIDTPAVYISDPYCAFEVYATGAPNDSFKCSFKRGSGTKASITKNADGVMTKIDWISIIPSNYHFTLTNYSSSTISVHLVYYSWA